MSRREEKDESARSKKHASGIIRGKNVGVPNVRKKDAQEIKQIREGTN